MGSKKKGPLVKRLECENSFIPYVELDNWTEENKINFCQDYFIPKVFGRHISKLIQDTTDIIYTKRCHDRSNELIRTNSYICIYDSDIAKCKKSNTCIICIETNTLPVITNEYVRVYILGFCQTQQLSKYLRTKILIEKGASVTKVQGVFPSANFYMLSITVLTRLPFIDDIADIKPIVHLQDVQIQAVVKTATVKAESVPRKRILLLRQEPTVYLYILNADHLGYLEIPEMLDLENECMERIQFLYSISVDSTTRVAYNGNRNSMAYYKDRRAIYTLALVMCWNINYRQWYVTNEIIYTEMICDSMVDIEDAELAIRFNHLENHIEFGKDDFDRNVFKKKICAIHFVRLNHIMDCFKDQMEREENIPDILQRLKKKLYNILDKKQETGKKTTISISSQHADAL